MIPVDSQAGVPLLIKFATLAPEGSTWMNHMRLLDKIVREKSRGALGFRLYPGGVAGDELDILRKIRIGQIHCAAFSGVGFGQILPMVRVLDLPFLFKDNSEADLVHNELKGFFSDQFRKKGFELLAWAEVGNVHLFSKNPIRNINDLSRQKIWTWTGDPIAKTTFSMMGTNPIPLSITDVTTALNTGMINTVYAPPLGALALQWNQYLNYMTTLPLTHSTGAVLLSQKIFEQIPGDLSGMLMIESEKVMAQLTKDLRMQAGESVKLLEKGGIQRLPMPGEQDLQEFMRVHEKVAQSLSGKVYPRELLERVYGLLKRD
ncbi:MAG: TRAP transporter substrate-binding protein DctP [Pseudomonadota bacterium]